LNFFPVTPYQPEFFLSCGIANRDFTALSQGAGQSRRAVTVICPGLTEEVKWSPNVKVIDGGRGWNSDQTKLVTAADLVRDYYPKTAATLVIMKADPTEYTANGFTNLIEAMAMGRPVIVTRTGALPVELDVEKAGCGLHVPAGDSQALAAAIETLAAQPERARIMGETGRRLCEKHYNSERYGRDLHAFFESL
jgi:glycosyltransferase involved in cell wall biosynthesis